MPVAVSMSQQIANQLREAITSGEYGPGQQIPTEPQLCERFGVARGTVRQALAALSAEGLLETRGRQGTYVRRLPLLQYPASPGTRPVYAAFAEQVAAGHEPREDFHFQILAATPEVAGQLAVPVDALVVVRTTTRFVDDVPFGRQTYFYPRDLAETAGLDVPRDIPEGTGVALERAGFPETGLTTRTRAWPATLRQQADFELGAGVWVITHRRTSYSGGRPIRYGVEELPADRTEIAEHHGDAPEGDR